MKVLEIKDVHITYGPSHIIFGISLAVDQGRTVCLLGRNGVGKTTTLRGIMGLVPPLSGTVTFKGEDITGKQPFVISRAGIGYVPEDKGIFRDLSVRENLKLGQMKLRGQRKWGFERTYALFPALKERASHQGTELSGGEQQMLAIARALMGDPDLLLLDEPSQGLAPILQQKLGSLIKGLKQDGITILLAEQSFVLASAVSDGVYILEKGAIRFQGTIEELECDEDLKREYLAV